MKISARGVVVENFKGGQENSETKDRPREAKDKKKESSLLNYVTLCVSEEENPNPNQNPNLLLQLMAPQEKKKKSKNWWTD